MTQPELGRPLASGCGQLLILRNLAATSRVLPFTRSRLPRKKQAFDSSRKMAVGRAFNCLAESLRDRTENFWAGKPQRVAGADRKRSMGPARNRVPELIVQAQQFGTKGVWRAALRSADPFNLLTIGSLQVWPKCHR
jgi:hypothetical protein